MIKVCVLSRAESYAVPAACASHGTHRRTGASDSTSAWATPLPSTCPTTWATTADSELLITLYAVTKCGFGALIAGVAQIHNDYSKRFILQWILAGVTSEAAVFAWKGHSGQMPEDVFQRFLAHKAVEILILIVAV